MSAFFRLSAAMLLGAAATSSPVSAAPAPSMTAETLAVTFLTPSLGWRASDNWNPNTGARGPVRISRSTDGGVHWRPISTVPRTATGSSPSFNVYAASLLFADARDGWLYGNRLFATHDGGRTWRPAIPLILADPGGGGVGPVQFVDARHGWRFSFPNLLFRTVDGGRHWQEIHLT